MHVDIEMVGNVRPGRLQLAGCQAGRGHREILQRLHLRGDPLARVGLGRGMVDHDRRDRLRLKARTGRSRAPLRARHDRQRRRIRDAEKPRGGEAGQKSGHAASRRSSAIHATLRPGHALFYVGVRHAVPRRGKVRARRRLFLERSLVDEQDLGVQAFDLARRAARMHPVRTVRSRSPNASVRSRRRRSEKIRGSHTRTIRWRLARPAPGSADAKHRGQQSYCDRTRMVTPFYLQTIRLLSPIDTSYFSLRSAAFLSIQLND